MRLIDADAIKYRTEGCGGWGIPENVVSDYEIAKMPTIDAVEVIRCRDCKYFVLNPFDGYEDCTRGFGYVRPDFGCVDGERRSE